MQFQHTQRFAAGGVLELRVCQPTGRRPVAASITTAVRRITSCSSSRLSPAANASRGR